VSYTKSVNEHSFSTSRARFFRDLVRYTVCRSLQHEIIERMNISGRTVDVGGGERSSYREILTCDEYISINIDSSIEPTHTVREQDTVYPVGDSTCDNCLMFNLVEHLYSWATVLEESRRMLKDGGKLHILVPFLYPIHPAPFDYIRPSEDYLYKKLWDRGFTDISIKSYNQGPLSQAALFVPFPKGTRRLIILLCAALDATISLLAPKKIDNYATVFPLFYYACATCSKNTTGE